MKESRFFRNQHFRKYIRLLRKLHELIRAGTDESDEGESVRDEMDRPSEYLTPEEIKSVNGISADLYSLSDGKPWKVQKMSQTAYAEVLEALAAKDKGEFAKALDLLRNNQTCFDLTALTYVRGSVMFDAGEFALAADFFSCVKELAPNNGNYTYMWLDALSRSNVVKASEEAKDILSKATDSSPKLVLKAAEIEFSLTRQLLESQAKQSIQKLIPVFEDIIVRLQTSGEAQENPALLAHSFALLGFCQEHLGEFDLALKSFDQGLSVIPNNDAILAARGILRYATDNSGAIGDFANAIQMRSKLVWPYFFMAHHHLTNDGFEECLNFAQSAFSLATSDAVRADCLEWIAICQTMLGYPVSTIRAAFTAALEIAPDNQRIEENRQRFENSLASDTLVNTWELMDSETVQSFGRREFQIAA